MSIDACGETSIKRAYRSPLFLGITLRPMPILIHVDSSGRWHRSLVLRRLVPASAASRSRRLTQLSFPVPGRPEERGRHPSAMSPVLHYALIWVSTLIKCQDLEGGLDLAWGLAPLGAEMLCFPKSGSKTNWYLALTLRLDIG